MRLAERIESELEAHGFDPAEEQTAADLELLAAGAAAAAEAPAVDSTAEEPAAEAVDSTAEAPAVDSTAEEPAAEEPAA